MKKFARCTLILLLVLVISGVGSFVYLDKTIKPQYESTAKLYVIPNDDNNASIRADDGGLNDDFKIVFTSEEVMSLAAQYAGTTEDLSEYLTINTPANSNYIELTITNPDLSTAKHYVDSVAKAAVKNSSMLPVKSIEIRSEGSSIGGKVKPNHYKYTFYITALAGGVCLIFEIIICLILAAFKKKDDDDDYDYAYDRRFSAYPYTRRPLSIEAKPIRTINHEDILATIDEEYEGNSTVYSSSAAKYPLYNAIDETEKKPERSLWEEAKAAEEAKAKEEAAAAEAEEAARKAMVDLMNAASPVAEPSEEPEKEELGGEDSAIVSGETSVVDNVVESQEAAEVKEAEPKAAPAKNKVKIIGRIRK